MKRGDPDGPVKSEMQAKQGGTSKMTLWILVASLALAAIVGIVLYTNANDVAPNRPNAVENPANPGSPAPKQK